VQDELPPDAGRDDVGVPARAGLTGVVVRPLPVAADPPAVPPAWLSAVADPGRVAAALRDLLGGGPGEPGADLPGHGRTDLRCELLDLRARGTTWRVRYRVVVESGPGAGSSVVLVGDVDPGTLGGMLGRTDAADVPAGAGPVAVEVARATGRLGTGSWRAWLPPLGLALRTEVADRRLPAAELLLDPATAAPLVERVWRSRDASGPRVDGCAVRFARYVYGARCTVVLDLQLAGAGPEPVVVVAKAHPDGAGAAVDAAMRALWATPLADGDVVRIAEPLGYLPDPGVLLQGAVPGDRSVRELLAGVAAGGDPDHAEEVLRRVADGLVALHGCGIGDAPLRTWADDVVRVRRTATRVAPGWPAAAEEVLVALEALDRAAAGTRSAGGPRPSHGAFRPSQVLVDGDRVAFVDFDGFCLAEPERDLGRFCKAMRKIVLARTATGSDADRARAVGRAERLVEVLLSRYADGAPLSVERVAAWEALDEVAGRAHRAATLRAAAVGLTAPGASAAGVP
jgi:hypothetical protein